MAEPVTQQEIDEMNAKKEAYEAAAAKLEEAREAVQDAEGASNSDSSTSYF